jgi:hypothetical protein
VVGQEADLIAAGAAIRRDKAFGMDFRVCPFPRPSADPAGLMTHLLDWRLSCSETIRVLNQRRLCRNCSR